MLNEIYEWNGYGIMQNEKFMELYCKHHNFEISKIDKTIVYFHKIPVFGYTIMKMHSPDIKIMSDNSDLIKRAMRISHEKNVAVLEILTAYKNDILSRYLVEHDGTIIINLNNTEDNLLKRIKKTTRTEIRQAQKKGVIIESAIDRNDFDMWWSIYNKTASLKNFKIQPRNLVYELFKNLDLSRLFVAKVDNKIIAGAFILLGTVPLYWLGGTNLMYSIYRPNNILQWEIIKWAKEQRYPYYDMGGAIIDKDHGPTKFKRGFGGEYKEFYIYRIPNGFIKYNIMKLFLKFYRMW